MRPKIDLPVSHLTGCCDCYKCDPKWGDVLMQGWKIVFDCGKSWNIYYHIIVVDKVYTTT